VTGILPIANGGTGATTLDDLITLATHTTGNYVATITGNTQVGVSGSGSENAGVTLSINANSIGDTQLAFDTGHHLTTRSTPTFSSLTLTTLNINGDTITDFVGTGLEINAGVISTTLGTDVDLTSEVTGTLPVGSGGTGVTSLSNVIGTTDQISVSGGTGRVIGGNVTLSLPQSIATTSTPTFAGITIDTDTITDFVGTGLQLNTGVLSTTLGTDIDLTSEVTGVLPVASGGTGSTTLNDLITLGTHTTGNYVATITGNTQIGVTGSGSENAGVTLAINADSIGDSQLTYNTGQHLTTTSDVTFNSLAVNSLSIGGIDLDAVGTTNVTSGASLVGVFDEFTNSSATTVQGVLA